MQYSDFVKCLEENPVIASTSDDLWEEAIASSAQVIFYLSANILSIGERTAAAHKAGKVLLVHADLAEGIGKDVEMIIGNGYTKNHAQITLDVLRESEALRKLFDEKYV